MVAIADRIEKRVALSAPRARVWHALADSREFGSWFGVRFDAPFAPGAAMHGVVVPTTVDANVAKAQKPYEGQKFEMVVDRMDTERLFSFRWHPGAVDPSIDYGAEPMTLVEFRLDDVANGTQLTLMESGFHGLPLERRAQAFANEEKGWTGVTMLFEKYLAQAK